MIAYCHWKVLFEIVYSNRPSEVSFLWPDLRLLPLLSWRLGSLCLRLLRSAWPMRYLWWLVSSCLLSRRRETISWSLLPKTRGRKREALSVLFVLKPLLGRPFPLIDTYHCFLTKARCLLPRPLDPECWVVEWCREAYVL